MEYRPHMLRKVRSDQIMASAAGMPCTLRIASFIPGRVCAGNNTTVGCHLEGAPGKGVSTKVTDMAVAFGCIHCHNIIARVDAEAMRFLEQNYPAAVEHRKLCALIETHALLIDAGVIVIPDGELV